MGRPKSSKKLAYKSHRFELLSAWGARLNFFFFFFFRIGVGWYLRRRDTKYHIWCWRWGPQGKLCTRNARATGERWWAMERGLADSSQARTCGLSAFCEGCDQDRSVDPNLKGYYSWVVPKVPKKLHTNRIDLRSWMYGEQLWKSRKKKGQKKKRKDVIDSRGRKKKIFVCRCSFVRSFAAVIFSTFRARIGVGWYLRRRDTKYHIWCWRWGPQGKLSTRNARAIGERWWAMERGLADSSQARTCGLSAFCEGCDQDRSVDPNLKGYYSWVVPKVPKKLAHKSHRFALLDDRRARLDFDFFFF